MNHPVSLRRFRWWPFVGVAVLLATVIAADGRSRRVQYFPMIAINGGAVTAFLLHNPGKRAIRVHLRLWAPSGAELVADQVSLGPRETRRVEYPGDTGKATGGWAQLTSDRPFLATELILAGPSPWIGVSAASPLRRFKIFGMVARADGLQTGLALTNPSPSKSADVRVVLYDMAGKEVRRMTLELPPLANTSG